MRSKSTEKRLLETDVRLLYQMYKYRALSTAQIKHVGNLGKWYVYEKLTHLRNAGYIFTDQISGNYIPDQRRQGSYHRVSGKAIRLLKKLGYAIDYTADEIRVSKYRLPYLLVGNDLSISLQDSGWQFRDSRAVKLFHNLNRGDVFHGTLINPNEDKEYSLYVFLRTVQANTLESVKREVIRNPFEDILVIARGSESFDLSMRSFTDNKNRLIKGGSIKLLPLRFAEKYLTISSDNTKNHEHFLKQLGITLLDTLTNKTSFETNVRFDYLVKHNNEEKYFVDLLDNDLMKIRMVEEYRKERYELDGRKMLVLTSGSKFHTDYQQKMLSGMSHVEFLTVDSHKVTAFASDLANKRTFAGEDD